MDRHNGKQPPSLDIICTQICGICTSKPTEHRHSGVCSAASARGEDAISCHAACGTDNRQRHIGDSSGDDGRQGDGRDRQPEGQVQTAGTTVVGASSRQRGSVQAIEALGMKHLRSLAVKII